MKKIAIFADIQNIFYTTREAFGKPFNYRAFYESKKQQGIIVKALAYAIDRGDTQQQKFQTALRHIGFDVKLKPYIQRKDGSAKGDWDVGITIDMMEIAPNVNHIILLSGDGDFDLLLQKVREKYNITTEVVSVEALTANSLIQSTDIYTPILPKQLL
ncbi:MAG: NYN domain-containing protein [Cellvibrionales bacterium]|nr:NYN domain-containing protein [Cellvibrionales bacterium]